MVQIEHANSHQAPQAPRHETGDMPIRGIALSGVGLVALLMVSLLTCYLLIQSLTERRLRIDVMPSPLAELKPPPSPHLQVNPAEELSRMRSAEHEILNGYGWVNQEIGIVRIPVEHAKELLLKRGLPTRKRPAGAGGSEDGETR